MNNNQNNILSEMKAMQKDMLPGFIKIVAFKISCMFAQDLDINDHNNFL